MIDLLAPVGNFECLKAAVQNGANSVYFGADIFSARAFAHNFNEEELKQAIDYAKIRGIKTNLTLNILIKDNDIITPKHKDWTTLLYLVGLFMEVEIQAINENIVNNVSWKVA